MLLFVLTLPMWLLLAKLQGLYERDEERTDHSTIDEFAGVLVIVTLGTWFFQALSWVTRACVAAARASRRVLAACDRLS